MDWVLSGGNLVSRVGDGAHDPNGYAFYNLTSIGRGGVFFDVIGTMNGSNIDDDTLARSACINDGVVRTFEFVFTN